MSQALPDIQVPASKLSIAPSNVRRRTDPVADSELKASILARGIIQNLIGLPVARRKGEYQITGGGRRLTQLKALIEEGKLPADYPVTVKLLSNRNDAAEISLVENFNRLNMSPAEECRAFQTIIETEKKSPADVAIRFGLTERFVLGRLRLAGLADPVFGALADGTITLDVAKAYGSITDTARQAAVFEELADGYYATNCAEIRRRLISGLYRGNDPKALLIGRDAYLAAGGRIDGDLFSDNASENWIDSGIVETLAQERLEAAAAELRSSEGFGELRVVCHIRVPYMETIGLDPVEGEPVELTPDEEERQRAIEVELETIAENADEDGYSDEEIQRIEALEAEYQGLTERPPVLGADQKAASLAYLVIGDDGTPRLHEQIYAIPQPEPEVDEDVDTQSQEQDESADEAVDEASGRSPISQKLAEELALMKTEILRVHVASDPNFALDLGAFIMADAAVAYRYDMPSDLRATVPSSRVGNFESDTPAAESWDELQAGLDRSWIDAGGICERYDAFCALADTARAAWLGWAVARTLHAVPAGERSALLIDHLGTKLDIDVAQWWRPTARRYFDRVAKPTILDHFHEVGRAELRSRYSGSKKHDLALSAEKLFGGQIIVEADIKDRAMQWLPDAMRFGPPEDLASQEGEAQSPSGEPASADQQSDLPEAA